MGETRNWRRRRDDRAPRRQPDGPEAENLIDVKRRAVHGFLWTGGATFVGLGVQLVYTASMGRLVDPAAFGLVAGAGVLTSILSLVSNFGLKSAVLQRENVDAADVRSAFTYAVLIGLALTLVGILLSGVAQDVLGVPRLAPLIRVLSLSLLTTSFGVVAEATLRRRLLYRAVAVIDLSAMTCGFLLVGIPLAIHGANAWSLVYAQLTYTTLDAFALLVVARHSLIPIFSWARARRFVVFGSGVSALSLFEYAGSNLDTVGVSRYLGAADLGQYSRATMLFSLPAEKATVAFSTVLFPVMARVQSSRERIRTLLEQSLGGVTMFVIPASILAGVAAPAVVRVVLGPSWGPAAAILPILALASALGLVSHILGLTFEAVGRLQEKFVIQGCNVALLAISLGTVIVVGPSLLRFSFAWLVAQVVEYLSYVVAARIRFGSSIEVTLLQLARATATGVLCAAPSFLIVRVAEQSSFVACVVGGLGALAILCLLWRTALMADARDVLQLLRDGVRRPDASDLLDPAVPNASHGADATPTTRERNS